MRHEQLMYVRVHLSSQFGVEMQAAGPHPYPCLGLSSDKPKLLKLLTVFTWYPQESFLQPVENPRRERCSQTLLSAKESPDCDSARHRRGWVRALQQHHAHLCSRLFKGGERWIKDGKGKSDTSRKSVNGIILVIILLFLQHCHDRSGPRQSIIINQQGHLKCPAYSRSPGA